MNRTRPILAGIITALLPFLAVNVAHSAPVHKTSKTSVSKAKSAKNKKFSAKKTRASFIKAKSAAKKARPESGLTTAVSAVVPAAAIAAPDAANPYLAQANWSAGPTSSNSYLAGAGQAATANPYLAYRQQSVPSVTTAAEPARSQERPPASATNPYLAYPQHVEMLNPLDGPSAVLAQVKMALPGFSGGGEFSILPKIKTVYPTGEKPLKVITFKCPTELIGVTPPPVKILHEGVNLAMDGLNHSNLLPFNLQQVCM